MSSAAATPAITTLPAFAALARHIALGGALLPALPTLPFFRCHAAELTAAEAAAVGKLLFTSWGTEYALRATLELGDDAFLAAALHWSLPQAYYATQSGLQAFLYTTGIRSFNTTLMRREAGRLVVKNAYPRPLSFYAAGAYGDFSIHRLPLAEYIAGPHVAAREIAAQCGLSQALKSARKRSCQRTRAEVQGSPNTAICSQQTGKPLNKWTKEHWQHITWRLGYTTVFDLLAGLKEPALPPADVRAFLVDLLTVVEGLASVHEAYVAKCLGPAYAELLAELPAHLQNSFVTERAERIALATGIESQRAGLAHMSRS